MKKKNDAPKRKLFGRNLFTLLVFGGGFIIIVLAIFSTVSYISTYNGSKITPFVDKNFDEQWTAEDYNVENAIRITNEELEEFGVIFTCTEYSEDSNTAKFKLKTYKKENTKSPIEQDGKWITANVMMTAEWINFVSYSSNKTTSLRMYDDEETANGSSSKSNYSKEFTVKNLANFPAKANTFPVKIEVDEPTIYLFISYNYKQNAEIKNLTYIIEYSYSDLIPETGGIRK